MDDLGLSSDRFKGVLPCLGVVKLSYVYRASGYGICARILLTWARLDVVCVRLSLLAWVSEGI